MPISIDDEPVATVTASRAPRAKKAVTKQVYADSDSDSNGHFSGDDDSDVFSDALSENESDFDSDSSSKKKKRAVAPRKRAPKQVSGAGTLANKQQVYSPEQSTPKLAKKFKKSEIPKAKAVKKAVKITKKKAISSDEEGVDSEEEVAVKRTPKPIRARKTTTYAAFLAENSDENDDLVDSEDDYSDD